MQPLRQKKYLEILDELNHLSADERRNDFVLRHYEKKANDLLDVDPAYSYVILGVISAMRRNSERVRYYFRRAIDLASANPFVYHNYSVALAQLGYFLDSAECAGKAHELDPFNIFFLDEYLRSLLISGQYAQANKMLERLMKLKPDYQLDEEIRQAVEIVHAECISNDDTVKIIEILSEFLRERNVITEWVKHEIRNDGYLKKRVFVRFMLDLPPEDVMSLASDFYSRLGDFPEKTLETFVIELTAEEMEQPGLTDEEAGEKIREYENRYGMTSDEFFQSVREGKSPDEYAAWHWYALLTSEKIKNMIEEGGRVPEARDLLATVPPRISYWTDYWKTVLALPKVRVGKKTTGGGAREDGAWLEKNHHLYKNKWVALKRGVLVGSHESRMELYRSLKQSVKLEGVAFLHIDG